jgi:Fe-S oxidoreductase
MQASGCCGMSGTYGHESRNLAMSKTIFEQSWGRLLDAPADGGELLATGYSCRSQTARLRGQRLRHPIEVLLEALSPPR